VLKPALPHRRNINNERFNELLSSLNVEWSRFWRRTVKWKICFFMGTFLRELFAGGLGLGKLSLLFALVLCQSCRQRQTSVESQGSDENFEVKEPALGYLSTDEDVAWQFVVEASFAYSATHKVELTQESLDATFDSIGDGTSRALSAAKMGLGIDQISSSGDSFLIAAIRAGDQELAALLLKKGANIDFRNKAGQTALDLAKQLGLTGIAQLLNSP